MTPQATLAVKCTEALKMKIKKYCQFERTSALETLLQTNNCLTLLDDYDSDGNLPVHICAENGSIECLKMICPSDRAEHISARNLKGLAPLHIASFYGYLKIMKLLVIMGEDINVLSRELMTPLQIAASRGNDAACRWLLSNNADIAVTDAYGRTALDSARKYKNNNCVKIILNYQVSKKTLRKQRSSSSLNNLNTLPNISFAGTALHLNDFRQDLRRGSYQGQTPSKPESQNVRRPSYQYGTSWRDCQLHETVYEEITEESIEELDSIFDNIDSNCAYERRSSCNSDVIRSDSISLEIDLADNVGDNPTYRRWTSVPSPRLTLQPKLPVHNVLKVMRRYFKRKNSGKGDEHDKDPQTLHKCLSYNSVRG